MGVHVVAVVEVAEHFRLGFVGGAGDLSVHHGETGEQAGRRAAELASDFRVVTADEVHVGAEAERFRVASRVRGGAARGLDAPRHAFGLGADGEQDPVGLTGRDADHLGAGGRDFHGHLRSIADPADAACRRTVRQSELRGERGRIVRNPGVLERDLLAAEIRLQNDEVVLEPAEARGRPAEVRQRAVAATDAQHHPAPRYALNGQRRRGSCRRMARHRVRHRGRDPQRLRGGGPEGEADVRVSGEVLRIDDVQAVPAASFCLAGEIGASGRRGDGLGPELHGCAPLMILRGRCTIAPESAVLPERIMLSR